MLSVREGSLKLNEGDVVEGRERGREEKNDDSLRNKWGLTCPFLYL